ncbi:uncharacterized protein LOC144115237 isoform X4 [Amblyomma americanum]
MNAGHKALEPSGTKTDAIEPRASTSKASESAARIQETREAQSLRNATPEKGAGPAKKEPSNLTECVPGNLEARSGENLLPKGQICKTLSSRIMQLHLCCQALNLDDPKTALPTAVQVTASHVYTDKNQSWIYRGTQAEVIALKNKKIERAIIICPMVYYLKNLSYPHAFSQKLNLLQKILSPQDQIPCGVISNRLKCFLALFKKK